MRPQVIAAFLLTGMMGPAAGQTAHFEAASLKRASDQDILESRPKRSVGRFHWKTSLLNLLSYAYHVEWWRISETPGLYTVYELEATTPPKAEQETARGMLRTLLIERFQLQVHQVTKDDVEGYALTVAKGGAKLQDAKPRDSDADSPNIDDGAVYSTRPASDAMTLRGHNASTLQLSEFLERAVGTHVIDQTKLTGKYDFDLTCTRDEGGTSANVWANCVKQIGLVLGKYKGPVEFLVIDHLGKLVEN